jgi:hypothetical protein
MGLVRGPQDFRADLALDKAVFDRHPRVAGSQLAKGFAAPIPVVLCSDLDAGLPREDDGSSGGKDVKNDQK